MGQISGDQKNNNFNQTRLVYLQSNSYCRHFWKFQYVGLATNSVVGQKEIPLHCLKFFLWWSGRSSTVGCIKHRLYTNRIQKQNFYRVLRFPQRYRGEFPFLHMTLRHWSEPDVSRRRYPVTKWRAVICQKKGLLETKIARQPSVQFSSTNILLNPFSSFQTKHTSILRSFHALRSKNGPT